MNEIIIKFYVLSLNVSVAHVEQKSGSWKPGPVTYKFSQPPDVSVQ